MNNSVMNADWYIKIWVSTFCFPKTDSKAVQSVLTELSQYQLKKKRKKRAQLESIKVIKKRRSLTEWLPTVPPLL